MNEAAGMDGVATARAGTGATGAPDDRAQRATVALEMERGPDGAEAGGGAETGSDGDAGSAATEPVVAEEVRAAE